MSSNVYAFPPPGVTAPAIVVGYPEEIDLQAAFGRGANAFQIPVWFAVSDQGVTADGRDALSAVLGSGTVIANVLSASAAWGDTSCAAARIAKTEIGGIEYLAVRFDVDVVTSGPLNLTSVMDGLAGLCTAAGL